MEAKTLAQFLALTFALTWGIAALLILFADQMTAIFGEIGLTNPLVILAVYSPGFVGVFLVWRHYGFKGLGIFFRALVVGARAPNFVGVPHPGHSRHSLYRRGHQGDHERPV